MPAVCRAVAILSKGKVKPEGAVRPDLIFEQLADFRNRTIGSGAIPPAETAGPIATDLLQAFVEIVKSTKVLRSLSLLVLESASNEEGGEVELT